jgi:flagellar hook-associated protein 1 FlgK
MDGHVVVQEENYRELEYYEDSNGDPQFAVAANAGKITITESMTGRFGGQVEAYDTITGVLNDLDDWVTQFVSDFNTVHQAGYDQNGSTGLDFFSVSSISPATSFSIDSNLSSDLFLIAVAGALNVLTGFPDAGDKDILDSLIALEDSTGYGGSGSLNPAQQLSVIYANVATDVRSAIDNYEMQSMRMEDIKELRAGISGVNLDEEAIKLMEYQASYEAASRVISVTNRLLGDLMEVV